MKRIHTVIYQEILPPAVIALIVLTFVVFTREMGRLSKLFIQQGAEAGTLGELILALLPQILIYTIPISFLVGVLVGFSRLASDSETVAMSAGGLSILQMIRPVLAVGLGVALLTAFMTFVLFPKGHSRLTELRQELGARPIKSDIKPRVFFEELPGQILYVEDQDLQKQTWKGVLMAEGQTGESRRLVMARQGRLILSPDNQRLQIDLEGGLTYEITPESPRKYRLSKFSLHKFPIQLPDRDQPGPESRRPREKMWAALMQDIQHGSPRDRRFALVELNRRFALPVSALLFAILGTVLGARPHRGGRAYGLVVGMALAFSYYALLESGVHSAEESIISIALGLWGPNLALALLSLAALIVFHLRPGGARLDNLAWVVGLGNWLGALGRRSTDLAGAMARRARRSFSRFQDSMPRIARVVDLYVSRQFALYFLATLSACLALYYLFTFFDLVDDLFANDVPYSLLAEYFVYLMPQSLSLLVPISTLIATLVTFGLLEKTNQMTALKACGISLYQAALPIFGLAVAVSAAGFVNQEYVLPYANQRQDNLRAVIKGRPAQTHYSPGHNWIFGKQDRLYNYRHYEPDRDSFVELSIYGLQIGETRLLSHTYARQAQWNRQLQSWILLDGWSIAFDQNGEEDRFEAFERKTLALESPSYFETGIPESDKMTYPELSSYISRLQQGGFEVDHLRTELHTKISFPLVPLIMILLGIPFAFTLGRKGALYGIAAGILIGIFYWGAFGVFGVMGAGGLLSPLLAAWGPNLLFAAGGAFLFLTVRT